MRQKEIEDIESLKVQKRMQNGVTTYKTNIKKITFTMPT